MNFSDLVVTLKNDCNILLFLFFLLYFQLKDLHSQGYSLFSIDSSGQTALHYGARYGHKEIVRYLISFAPNSIINMVDNET